MRWESMRLPVGPYGLREIHTHPVWNAVNPVVQFMGNRETQPHVPVAVTAAAGAHGNRVWVGSATFMQDLPDSDRKAARDWLLNMIMVWAKEDE